MWLAAFTFLNPFQNREKTFLGIRVHRDLVAHFLVAGETYSSFANTDGGVILLGVEERTDGSLEVTGVQDPEHLKKRLLEHHQQQTESQR